VYIYGDMIILEVTHLQMDIYNLLICKYCRIADLVSLGEKWIKLANFLQSTPHLFVIILCVNILEVMEKLLYLNAKNG